jgi:hypothetical protein
MAAALPGHPQEERCARPPPPSDARLHLGRAAPRDLAAERGCGSRARAGQDRGRRDRPAPRRSRAAPRRGEPDDLGQAPRDQGRRAFSARTRPQSGRDGHRSSRPARLTPPRRDSYSRSAGPARAAGDQPRSLVREAITAGRPALGDLAGERRAEAPPASRVALTQNRHAKPLPRLEGPSSPTPAPHARVLAHPASTTSTVRGRDQDSAAVRKAPASAVTLTPSGSAAPGR